MTVETNQQFHGTVTDALETLAVGGRLDEQSTLSFTSYEELLKTFTPTTLLSSKPFDEKNQRASMRQLAQSTAT